MNNSITIRQPNGDYHGIHHSQKCKYLLKHFGLGYLNGVLRQSNIEVR